MSDGCQSYGNGKLWICRPHNPRYQARARWPGYQKYQLIGKPTRSYRKALRNMADAFATGQYKRADILFFEKPPSYYDPMVLCELVKHD